MRVLHVITALGVGGAERMLLKLLSAKALSGHEQSVIAMLPGGPMATPMRSVGAQVHEVDFLGGFPVVSGAWGLARIARQLQPDIVQGWMYHGNLGALVARASLRRSVPLIWGVRQSLATLEGENNFAKAGIYLNRMASHAPDRLLFNSQTSFAQHRDFGFYMGHADHFPNGFETDAFAPDASARSRLRASWKLDEDIDAFGVVARYHPSKGHAAFLEAARIVHDARPRSRFVLAGTGMDSANDRLMHEIAARDLTDQVVLLGERHDVPAVLAALDIYVSPSTAVEAFSNSIGEAMSCELPCVATKVGDSPLIIGDTGKIVSPGDPTMLAEAMIEMIDLGVAGRAKLGRKARLRIKSQFDIEAVAGKYASLYRTLIDESRAKH